MMNVNHFIRPLKLLVFACLCLAMSATATTPEFEPEHRIISTDASVTNLLFEFDQQNSLIAVDVTSQLPKGFKTLPNIGYHRNLSAEGLLSLKPSIVIGSEMMGPENVIKALTQAGIPFLQLPTAKTIDTLKININQVAQTLNEVEKSAQLMQWIDEQAGRLEKQSLKEERIAFLLSMDPTKLRLAGKGTNGDALITLLGAKNISDFENYRNVSAESLLAMKPTVILVAGRSPSLAVEELLKAQTSLQYSEAVQTKKIKGIDGRSLVAGLSVAALKEALSIAQYLNSSLEK
jgi:iron complex transport system substrate-binding protein